MTKKFGKPSKTKSLVSYLNQKPINGLTNKPPTRPHFDVTFTDAGMLIESGNGYRYVKLGGIKIVRPRVHREILNRQESETHMRAKYSAGKYNDPQIINEILNRQVEFFEKRIDKTLRRLSSYGCLHFLFEQYDLSKKIENKFNAGELSSEDTKQWETECVYARRAYKFLCERIVLVGIDCDRTTPVNDLPALYDEAIICAEQLVKFSMASDETRYLFPDQSVFTIFPEGDEIYWDLGLTEVALRPDLYLSKAVPAHIRDRVIADAKVRDDLFDGPAFDHDWKKHDEIIGEAFEIMAGVRYEKALQALSVLPKMCRPGDLGSCSIPKEKLIEGVAINIEIPVTAVRKIFSGFELTIENMGTESRNFWNPKNIYRAYRRGMFEICVNNEANLTWSDSMYKESWFMLMLCVAYGILPPEWEHPALKTAVGQLTVKCGHWFEGVVKNQMTKLGIKAINSRQEFGRGPQRIVCPVGEIDLIGYSESDHILIVGECKMTMAGAEPKFFRDELEDFVKKEKSHANKFRKKIKWVEENLQELSTALNSTNEFSCKIEPNRLAPIMVTFLPSVASYFIKDFPCISLSELISAYLKDEKWPYLSFPSN